MPTEVTNRGVGLPEAMDLLKGDPTFEECAKAPGAITPVSGSVGPMTIATLMANTVVADYRKACRTPPSF